jgi:hypothetical protein
MERFEGELIDSASIRPRYLRVRDAVRYSSIPHTSFYELIASGEIRTVALRKKGNVAGIRLVDIQSLDEFLAKHSEGGDEPTIPIAIPPLKTRKTARLHPGKKTASRRPKEQR